MAGIEKGTQNGLRLIFTAVSTGSTVGWDIMLRKGIDGE